MEEINLVVMIEVMPGKRCHQLEAYEKLKPFVLAEPGCLQYELFSDSANENKFVLIEKWASKHELDAHDQAKHMIAADAYNPTFRAKPAIVIKMTAVNI
ncbi:MAG: antibiotic biosynthesis monooxygenase family protein [Marinagarivorans sp.]|nr:antibiotic biosynthesis monooxygenase family protein [Marinagarivorans sp.]